ncbi:CLUMA_CG003914, isoform A [Clunio marinus]|uniref:CLUMA_CG003914, isoform A n=1 Tax=Clunio marinus TaxID=568069 RepID=A0A1J1HQ63_9DIPT|nr:CLUMA_CG003914, isoform A [Clunio marinus]
MCKFITTLDGIPWISHIQIDFRKKAIVWVETFYRDFYSSATSVIQFSAHEAKTPFLTGLRLQAQHKRSFDYIP